jgi:hydroxyacylglutathione hydrolase
VDVITIETPSLGDRSYLAHDGRVALVVDPQRDISRILDAADAAGVTITHVAETHLHNDYVSGGLVLSRVTGAEYVHAANEQIRLDHTPVADGDTFEVGSMQVEVLHTPGHTPHHLSYVVRSGDQPPATFTGGSLLYGTVGRTDLVSADLTDELTRAQFRTARRLASALPDDARIYPTHGFGSFCASAKSDEDSDGTLGTERQINLAFSIDDEDQFVERLVEGLTAYPRYYAHMGPMNRAGGTPIDLSPPTEVDPVELARRIHRGEWVVDLRQRRLFASDHVTGTISIELEDGFSTYVGWLIPWGTPLTLLGDTIEQVGEAQRQLVRIGIDRPQGAATGEPAGWAGESDRSSYPAVTFADVASGLGDGVVLDVRRPDERADGHIEGSVSIPIDELQTRIDEVPDATLWVHCATGFRANIAASLLERAGRDVVLVDDEFDKAEAAGLPIRS